MVFVSAVESLDVAPLFALKKNHWHMVPGDRGVFRDLGARPLNDGIGVRVVGEDLAEALEHLWFYWVFRKPAWRARVLWRGFGWLGGVQSFDGRGRHVSSSKEMVKGPLPAWRRRRSIGRSTGPSDW
jgi:hypothetical protein